MKVYYLDLNVVDCTADPHILEYDAVETMLEDVLKVCESDIVRAINVVRLYMGKILTIIGENGAGTYNVAFITYEDICNVKIFIKVDDSMVYKLRSRCGKGEALRNCDKFGEH